MNRLVTGDAAQKKIGLEEIISKEIERVVVGARIRRRTLFPRSEPKDQIERKKLIKSVMSMFDEKGQTSRFPVESSTYINSNNAWIGSQ